MKKFLLPLLCLSLTACEGPNNIKGQLSLTRPTTIHTPGGNVAKLAAARYGATIQMKADSALVFVDTAQGSVQFAVPGVAADGQGRFSIPANKMGQEFGLNGQIATTSSPFDRVEYVYCVWDTRTTCRRLADGSCEWIEEEIPGRQQERQIGEARTKSVRIDLVAKGKRSGQFNGSYFLGETIHQRYDIGGCER